MKYNIVILGAGQVGFHLVRAFASAGHSVSVWSRHHLHAVESAGNTGATALSHLSEIPADTDCCIAALSEHAISEVCPQLPISKEY
jgi:3-hydroxyisobutyrate dehydrogenase-like beta-hydroxyacid dehydrogenase